MVNRLLGRVVPVAVLLMVCACKFDSTPGTSVGATNEIAPVSAPPAIPPYPSPPPDPPHVDCETTWDCEEEWEPIPQPAPSHVGTGMVAPACKNPHPEDGPQLQDDGSTIINGYHNGGCPWVVYSGSPRVYTTIGKCHSAADGSGCCRCYPNVQP